MWDLVACATRNWLNDRAATLGAALAFYCAFSIAPLLVLLVTLAGWIVGPNLAYSYLAQQLTSLFGTTTAAVLIEAARNAQSGDGTIAAIISGVTLLVGASTVFSALESALEVIWGAQALVPAGIRGFIRSRLLSLGFILAIGFLLLVSLTLSTALSALQERLMHRSAEWIVIAEALDLGLSTLLSAVLFAMAYRYMPSKRVAWRLVASGAIVTSLLFQLGRWAIGWYLGQSTQPSAFGAAASFVALLLWLYYSAQIFLFGAEFTACMANLRSQTTPWTIANRRPLAT
jgi:membrane protein